MSGRLVAPMMKTVFFEFMPSISVRSWLRTRSAAPPASPAEELVFLWSVVFFEFFWGVEGRGRKRK
jgi:hypothetical protein